MMSVVHTLLGLLAGVAGWLILRSGGYRLEDDTTRLHLGHAWLMILGGAGAGVIAGLHTGLVAAFVGLYLFGGAALSWIDLDVHRLPTRILIWWAPILLLVALTTAATHASWPALGRALLAAAALGLLFLLLSWGGSMGQGDVKLSLPTGLVLGWFGWSTLIWAVVFTYALALVAVLILLTRGRSLSDHIPFGPAIVAGSAIALTLAAG